MSANTRSISHVEDAIPLVTPYPPISRAASPSLQNLHDSQTMALLPMAHQHTQKSVTCYDHLGRPETHGPEQRYVSPTTGVCRKLTVQAVHPKGPVEHRITDQITKVNQLGIWLYYTSPLDDGMSFKWIGTWLLFALKLTWSLVWMILQAAFSLLGVNLGDQPAEDPVDFTGRYKPYYRPFRGQLWEARSRKEISSRSKGPDMQVHSHYPRILMLRDSTQGRWVPCEDRDTIIRTKYIAISYSATDVYTHGPSLEREREEFKEEVRAAVTRQDFDAYWLDLESLSDDEEKRKLDLYCMADVYRKAERTLIVLGKSEGEDDEDNAWKRWGDRVWTFPEALLSRHLYCMFRGRTEIGSVSLHQVASLAYPEHDLEQVIINAYSGEYPLERLERLSLLKAAIFRRDPRLLGKDRSVSSPSSSPSGLNPNARNTSQKSSLYEVNRVYAFMCFFEHHIEPDHSEMEECTFARLSMANANYRIAERMVSLLSSPSNVKKQTSWYADDDVYSADVCDILPEVRVAGITETGALVLDGCRAACIRWKDFPELTFTRSDWGAGKFLGLLPSLAWPLIFIGVLFSIFNTVFGVGGVISLTVGVVLLVSSPGLFVLSEGKRVDTAQPWLIGVKGVLDVDAAASHLAPGGNKGHRFHLAYTPSGSPFAVAEERGKRAGSKAQYHHALEAERGSQAGRMYTLIDTCSATIHYFAAERPPTVCLFTGQEGGLGRFVLCSERCSANELRKETVLRMPTEVSQWMNLSGWIALS